MSKILIVGDVHGRAFWRKALELIDEIDKVVFLGDYLDPYPDENISFDDAIEEFKQILKFKEKYNDKVILLTGNHDWHYINKEFPDCSRRNYKLLEDLNNIFTENINKFQLIYQLDNYLFSHAGVYEYWMGLCGFTLLDLEDFSKFISDNWPSLSCVSFYRGGWHKTGSCIWADIRESARNKLYTDFIQIVGHTQLEKDPYVGDQKIKCLDVRKCFILNTETDDLEMCL